MDGWTWTRNNDDGSSEHAISTPAIARLKATWKLDEVYLVCCSITLHLALPAYR